MKGPIESEVLPDGKFTINFFVTPIERPSWDDTTNGQDRDFRIVIASMQDRLLTHPAANTHAITSVTHPAFRFQPLKN